MSEGEKGGARILANWPTSEQNDSPHVLAQLRLARTHAGTKRNDFPGPDRADALLLTSGNLVFCTWTGRGFQAYLDRGTADSATRYVKNDNLKMDMEPPMALFC